MKVEKINHEFSILIFESLHCIVYISIIYRDIKQGEERLYEYGVKNLTHGISIFSKFLSFLLSCQHLSNISFLTYFIKGQMISKTTFQVSIFLLE